MTGARTRIRVDTALLALVAVAALAALCGLAVVRPLSVALAALLVPGGAVLTRLRVDDAAGAAALAIGLSLAVETLLAGLLAASHLWHPLLLAAVVAIPSCALLWQDLRAAREAA